jgi:hypothetical protein
VGPKNVQQRIAVEQADAIHPAQPDPERRVVEAQEDRPRAAL